MKSRFCPTRRKAKGLLSRVIANLKQRNVHIEREGEESFNIWSPNFKREYHCVGKRELKSQLLRLHNFMQTEVK